MDFDQKQLLQILARHGGTADITSLASEGYFPNASLQQSADALIEAGMVSVTSYYGNVSSQGWESLTITGAGEAALDSA